MATYIEFPLENGGSILVETSDEANTKGGAGFMRGEPTAEAAKRAQHSFEAAMENIRHSANQVVEKLRGLSQPPDEMEVAFALKASGEFGNLAIGNLGGEANYSVKLVWRKTEKKEEVAGG